MTVEEVRITCESTGGEKGSKPFQMSYIPIECMNEILSLYHEGAKKYQKNNWMLGYDWDLSYDAGMRHFMQFWDGESTDEETGCSHLASVVFHAISLMYFEKHHPELDNRNVKENSPSIIVEKQGAYNAPVGSTINFAYAGYEFQGKIVATYETTKHDHSYVKIEREDGNVYSLDRANILEVVS